VIGEEGVVPAQLRTGEISWTDDRTGERSGGR
jgi:hypothetical protein